MDQNSFNRTRRTVWIAVAVFALGLFGYALRRHGAPAVTFPVATPHEDQKNTGQPGAVFNDYQPPATNSPQPVLKLNADTLMGTINGHVLAAADVLPPGSFNEPVSLDVCRYFLDRAIDRELILQTAKAQGVALDEAQRQQMLNFESTREQHGTGLVHDLNGGPAQVSFEMRDAEAFMLQTSLMEKSGASPNVTSQQVMNYYRQHASEFGALPAEGTARQEAWSQIDFNIRQTLAFSVRSDFQTRLADYMNHLKTAANIELTPLASLAGN